MKYKILRIKNIWRARIVPFELCPIDTKAITAGKTNTNETIEFLTALSDRPAIPVKVICSLYSNNVFMPCCRVAKYDWTTSIKITLAHRPKLVAFLIS